MYFVSGTVLVKYGDLSGKEHFVSQVYSVQTFPNAKERSKNLLFAKMQRDLFIRFTLRASHELLSLYVCTTFPFRSEGGIWILLC